jgi:hypothetical protein
MRIVWFGTYKMPSLQRAPLHLGRLAEDHWSEARDWLDEDSIEQRTLSQRLSCKPYTFQIGRYPRVYPLASQSQSQLSSLVLTIAEVDLASERGPELMNSPQLTALCLEPDALRLPEPDADKAVYRPT